MLETPIADGPQAVEDSTLLLMLKRDDSSALGTIYSWFVRAVYTIVLSQIGDRPTAEDVSQETFLTFWTQRQKIVLHGDSLLPWLLATARFKSLNARRVHARERRMTTQLEDDTPSGVGSPLEQVEAEQVNAYIHGVLSGLSSIDRSLLEMCIVDRVTYADAAKSLGLTHHSLRGRLARLRGRVRRELEVVKGES